MNLSASANEDQSLIMKSNNTNAAITQSVAWSGLLPSPETVIIYVKMWNWDRKFILTSYVL